MRIAVLNRDPNAYPGGDVVHITQLSQALKALGVEREYLVHWEVEDLKEFDLVHIHHVNFGWSRINFDKTKASGMPYVITAIFYPTEGLGMNFREIREGCGGAERVVFYSDAEATEFLQTVYSNLTEGSHLKRPAHIIPPGVSPAFIKPFSSRDRHGVLADAARLGDKNTDRVEAACKRFHIPFRLAQGRDYDELPPIYQKARVFVNASGSERFGLSILQGLAAGCKTLATKHSRGLEWFPGIRVIDPDDYEGLVEAIRDAYIHDEWDWRPNWVAREMTWESAARKWKGLYEEVIRGS